MARWRHAVELAMTDEEKKEIVAARILVASTSISAATKPGASPVRNVCPGLPHHAGADLRTLDRHRDAAVTSLIPALSCRSCRPNAPFAELVRLSKTSIADEMREERARRVLFSAGVAAALQIVTTWFMPVCHAFA